MDHEENKPQGLQLFLVKENLSVTWKRPDSLAHLYLRSLVNNTTTQWNVFSIVLHRANI